MQLIRMPDQLGKCYAIAADCYNSTKSAQIYNSFFAGYVLCMHQNLKLVKKIPSQNAAKFYNKYYILKSALV